MSFGASPTDAPVITGESGSWSGRDARVERALAEDRERTSRRAEVCADRTGAPARDARFCASGCCLAKRASGPEGRK
jgi:hypothetical protein